MKSATFATMRIAEKSSPLLDSGNVTSILIMRARKFEKNITKHPCERYNGGELRRS